MQILLASPHISNESNIEDRSSSLIHSSLSSSSPTPNGYVLHEDGSAERVERSNIPYSNEYRNDLSRSTPISYAHDTIQQSPFLQNSAPARSPSGQASSASSTSNEAACHSTPTSTSSQPIPTGLHDCLVEIPRLASYSCINCSKSFGTPPALARHLDSEHRIRCEKPGCDQLFTNERGRDRHYLSQKHRAETGTSSAGTYQCHCGKENLRKDLHKRHLGSCKNVAAMLYQCYCGVHTGDKEEHVAHLGECKTRKVKSIQVPGHSNTGLD